MTLNNSTKSSTSTGIGFLEPNATSYTFVVGEVPGYASNPSSGRVSVMGAPVSETVVFSPVNGPLGAQGWANVTIRGGGGNYCIGDSGQIGTHPAWENVSFVALAWNGNPPYQYVWSFGDGTENVSGARVYHTYQQYGNWHVILTVTDASAALNTTRLLVQYIPPPDPVPVCSRSVWLSLGLTAGEGYALISGIVVVAAVACAVLWRRRKKDKPAQSRNP